MIDWNEERKEFVKTLWLEGRSGAEIAKRIPGATRNAIIGVVHRMCLSGRQGASQPAKVKRVASAPKVRIQRPSAPRLSIAGNGAVFQNTTHAAPLVERLEPAGALTIMQLTAHTCRWPIGSGDTITFCGCKPMPDRPYCEPHFVRSIAPKQPRKIYESDFKAARAA